MRNYYRGEKTLSYEQQLTTFQWENKRRWIINRDHSCCRICNEWTTKPDVHHLKYIWGKMAWEYPDELLITTCRECHEEIESLKKLFSMMMNDQLGLCMAQNFMALANGKQWSEFITILIALKRHPDLLEETYQTCLDYVNLNPAGKDEN